MLFDVVQFVITILNNFLNGKKYFLSEFTYDDQWYILLNCPAGYISWRGLHALYDKDNKLKRNLKLPNSHSKPFIQVTISRMYLLL